MKKNQKKKKGFSVYETMIAMFVLVVGILAALGLITSSMRRSMESRDYIVGAALAQEGIELVRNIRDNNLVSSRAYDENIISGGCISYNQSSMGPCGNPLKLSADNFYTHGAGTTSKYHRQLIVSASEGGKLVKSLVWWGGVTSPGTCDISTKCVEVSDLLMPREY
jgi:Tfp pilus assembly protein PilV